MGTFIVIGVVGALILPTAAAAQAREVKKLQLEQFFDFESVSKTMLSRCL